MLEGLNVVAMVFFMLVIAGCNTNPPPGEETSVESVSSPEVSSPEENTPSEEGITGNFVNAAHPTQGKVSIVQENGESYLEFDSDFSSDRGPDLFVLLHRSPVPQTYEETEYLSLGELEKTKGTQQYPIPADLELTEFRSVVIWCRQFNVTFGYATLNFSE